MGTVRHLKPNPRIYRLTMYTIYILQDPRTEQVRYVGVTRQQIRRRLSGHLAEARRGDNTHRSRWIRALLTEGVEPVVVSLFKAEPDAWQEMERAVIAAYREAGAPLVNATDGGDGVFGHTHSVESRAKMSVARRGKPHSPEHRAKIGAAQKGKVIPPEVRAKMSAARNGSTVSAATRTKMAAAQRARFTDEGERAKTGAATKIALASPEVRARIGAATKAALALPEVRAKMSKRVRCVETGEVFSSMRAAASAIKRDSSAIGHSIRLGIAAGGVHWEHAD